MNKNSYNKGEVTNPKSINKNNKFVLRKVNKYCITS